MPIDSLRCYVYKSIFYKDVMVYNMVVAHNLLAMNANRQFSINTNIKAKSTEKLSSGFKINRASDDAAGLSISEGMRKRIRGLNQGAENIQDGISLCQVADGALTEIHSMLHRMTELAVQSANGTNSAEDRRYLNEEVNQIKSEIERIATTTDFSGKIYPLTAEIMGSAYGTIPGGTIKYENLTLDFDYNSDKFDARPFNENTPLDEMGLYVQVKGTDSNADGRLYNILYAGGTKNTDQVINGLSYRKSYSGVIFKAGDVSKNVEFSDKNFKFKSFTDDSANGTWSRVFSYTDPEDSSISFDIHQTVTRDNQTNSYRISTSLVSTGATSITDKLVYQSFDTAYGNEGNGDNNEGYYLGSGDANQINTETVYLKGGSAGASRIKELGDAAIDIYNHYNNPSNHHTLPGSVLIGSKDINDNSGWLPFSIEISHSGHTFVSSDWGDFLIIGHDYNSGIDIFKSCENDGTGTDLYGENHAFTYASFEGDLVIGIAKPDRIVSDISSDLPDTKVRIDTLVPQESINIQCSNKVDDSLSIDVVDARLSGLNLLDADISTKDRSLETLRLVSNAIDKVSEYRSYFGAQQNRLEHSFSVNKLTEENLEASESRIRDTDMAEEIVRYTKQNILEQAVMSMLSQANQSQQGMLSLLVG